MLPVFILKHMTADEGTLLTAGNSLMAEEMYRRVLHKQVLLQ
jgi:hypothetical protein